MISKPSNISYFLHPTFQVGKTWDWQAIFHYQHSSFPIFQAKKNPIRFFRTRNSINLILMSIATDKVIVKEQLLAEYQLAQAQYINYLYNNIWHNNKDYTFLSELYQQIEQNPSDTALIQKYFRVQRFILQAASKSLLKPSLNFNTPHFQNCLSIPRKRGERIQIISSTQEKKQRSLYYSGVGVCHNVWCCPICSSKITEKRREEILNAVKIFRDEKYGMPNNDLIYPTLTGGEIIMATFTVPHLKAQKSLESFVNKFNEAFRDMKQHRPYEKWLKDCQVKGTIQVLEVTYGEKNGWHVHAHVAYFLDSQFVSYRKISGLSYKKVSIKSDSGNSYEKEIIDFTEIRPTGKISPKGYNFFYDENGKLFYEGKNSPLIHIVSENGLFPIWAKTCQKMGFDAPSPLAFDLSSGDALSDYIAKYGKEPEKLWDLSLEISKQHVKSQEKFGDEKIKRASPFDLLRRYTFMGDNTAGDLYCTFAEAFKGKHNIHWSRGFKKTMCIEEISDKNIAEGNISDTNNITLGSLNFQQWRKIMRSQSKAFVLELCRENGFNSINEYLEQQQ